MTFKGKMRESANLIVASPSTLETATCREKVGSPNVSIQYAES